MLAPASNALHELKTQQGNRGADGRQE
jgi:hypothetical protein